MYRPYKQVLDSKICDYCKNSIFNIDLENKPLFVVFFKGNILYFDTKQCQDEFPLNEVISKTLINKKMGVLS